MGKSLYQIEEDYKAIITAVEEADGELSSEMEDALAINESELEQKCKGYHYVMNFYDADAEEIQGSINVYQREIDRLTKLKEEKERKKARLEGSILGAVMLFGVEAKNGVKHLEFDTVGFSTRRTKGGVNVHTAEELETKFCDFKLTLSKLTKEESREVSEIITKYFEEKSKSFMLKDDFTINKTRIKEAIAKIVKENEARKTLDPDGELEPEEVPGASMHPDTVKLKIK